MIISNGIPAPANPLDAVKVSPRIDIDSTHFNVFSVLRAILGVPTGAGAPSTAIKTPLVVAELAPLATLVDAQLSDPPGTRRVVPL